MQAADAGQAIKRLLELADKGPGAHPEALQEAQSMLNRLGSQGQASGYLSEKLAATKVSFETWLSERNWQANGSGDPQSFRTILLHDIEKLRKALARGAAGQD